MKVLLTGGAGFIGSHVVDGLLENGYQVVVADNLSSGSPRNLNPRARFYELDICDPKLEEIFAQERPDYVNHHAAQIDVRHSVAEPIYDARVNILGSLNLLENSIRHEVKHFLYISSGGAVYGEPEYLPCDEEHPIRPLSPYGASKYAVELYLYLYRQNYGLNYSILRYPNVYGPRQDPHGEAGVVAIFSQRMLKGAQVIINGTGEQERDFVYIDDCVRANLAAMDKGDGQVYNLGSGFGTSINGIFAHLSGIAGYSREPAHGPPKRGEVFKIYLDAAKASRELDWGPSVTLEEGLARTVHYFQRLEDG